MNILTLLPDAFGGRGGIAKFNRDLLQALCHIEEVEEVVAYPLWVNESVGLLPRKLRYMVDASGSKIRYAWRVLSSIPKYRTSDLIICGHIHLLPLASLAAVYLKKPLILIIHGIDAWTPATGRIVSWALKKVNVVVSVSHFTLDRFLKWSGMSASAGQVVPNCIDLSVFTPGPKNTELVDRYALGGKRVLLTVARLSSEERYKGIDEVMEVLPRLLTIDPDLVYLVVGDGNDRARLLKKSRDLGIQEHVIFAGYIPEAEKVDHYRLADVFVMPGRGEGFGIVYLEAMACGVPVVASSLDASQEVVLFGRIGEVASPDQPEAIIAGIQKALARSTGCVPEEIDRFSFRQFEERWSRTVKQASII